MLTRKHGKILCAICMRAICERADGSQKTMNRKSKDAILFLIQTVFGAGFLLGALAGAFLHLEWYYFTMLVAVGCGLIGQKSVWEKIATIVRSK